VPKVYDLFKAMSPDAPVHRGNWAVFHDLDGVLDLYTPTGHVERNEVTRLILLTTRETESLQHHCMQAALTNNFSDYLVYLIFYVFLLVKLA
jgi:hypothetical protein